MVVSYKESGCKVNSSESGEVFTTCLVRFCLYSHSLCTHLYWFKFAFITRQLISIYGIGFVMFYSKKVNMYIHVYEETCYHGTKSMADKVLINDEMYLHIMNSYM